MLEVAEFQQLALPFSGRESGIEVPHGGKQRPQPRQGDLPVGLGFGLRLQMSWVICSNKAAFVRRVLISVLVVAAQTLFSYF